MNEYQNPSIDPFIINEQLNIDEQIDTKTNQ